MKTEELFPGGLYLHKPLNRVVEYRIDSQCESGIYDGERQVHASPALLAPIPLTPEILRDWFGAKFNNGKTWRSQQYTITFDPDMELRFRGYGKNKKGVIGWNYKRAIGFGFFAGYRIGHVHELQRLYHALTGEPLKRL